VTAFVEPDSRKSLQGTAHYDGTESLRTLLFHERINRWNKVRLEPSFPTPDWQDSLEKEARFRSLEGEFLESERESIRAQADTAPEDADGFMRWFEELRASGPGQGDPLFPWLASHATLRQMRWFLFQETAGEAGFDDLVAMTQVKLPARAKLELARNYWDEMGRGQAKGMHGRLLEKTAEELSLKSMRQDTVWESLALANLMAGLACNRRYAYHSLGALGVIEMTAPDRVSHVDAGLKRLGVPAPARHYFALHAALDRAHSAGWNAEAIRPLVEGNPWIARAIAEGALMRLAAGKRCFERYRLQFGI
jgi:Iron-containing redox enzyme